MDFLVGPGVIEILLSYHAFCMIVYAFPLAVDLPSLWVLPSPSRYCVLFFYTSIRTPMIGVGVLVLSELLWRRCVIYIHSHI